MSFLFPLFVVGAGAVAVPIVLHLIRRRTRRDVPFSSLMFLSATTPRFESRKRVEHRFLLALRCIALFLLVLAFARPFFASPPPALATGTGIRVVLLIDTSASMRRQGLWEAAVANARAAIEAAGPADRVALMAFDRETRVVFGFSAWAAMAPGQRTAFGAERLAALAPGWAATDIGRALAAAIDAIIDEEAEEGEGTTPVMGRRVVLVSDLQQGSRMEALRPSDWPAGAQLVLAPVRATGSTNAAVQAVVQAAGDEAAESLRVRVSNSTDAKRDKFSLRWQAPGAAALPIDVPPGATRVVRLPGRAAGITQIGLSGDDDEFDNQLYLAPQLAPAVTILYIGADDGTDSAGPLYFLRRAFPPTRAQTPEVLARKPDDGRIGADAAVAHLIVVTAPLGATALAALAGHLGRGRMVLWALDGTAAARNLATLVKRGELGAAEKQWGSGTEAGYGILSQVELRDPLLAPFAEPRFSDFTKIHFWKYRRLDDRALKEARVVARFDDGAAAWLTWPVGKGAVFVMTSGWQPADSQLALSSKFAPLMQSLLEASAGLASGQVQFFVGDKVPLPASSAPGGDRKILKPDGSTVALDKEARVFGNTDLPGVYSFKTAASTLPFAVNVAPTESVTAPMALEPLERLGGGAATGPAPNPRATASALQSQREAHNANLEGQQKLWRWAILGLLLVLIVETAVAGRLARATAVGGPT